MRTFNIFVASLLLCGSMWGQQAVAPVSQSARQALIEMLFSKTPGTFLKHLPVATRSALEKSGALAGLQQYSLMASQFEAHGKNLETFETGSVLLATLDPNTEQKVEITVENDALQGDQDDIELSFQTYKNGQQQRTPYMPHLTFSMRMESGVWKLNEISITVRLPLADPDLLKSIEEGMKARTTAVNAHIQPQAQGPTQTVGTDESVVTAMRTILTAEIVYARRYTAVGFTCAISDLDGFGGGEANEHQAMLINSGLASGKRYGYVFTLSQCAGNPATKFHLTAAPNGNNFGRRAFCADQSGVIRYSADGNPSACLAEGVPLQ
jgi:hypothetical protein